MSGISHDSCTMFGKAGRAELSCARCCDCARCYCCESLEPLFECPQGCISLGQLRCDSLELLFQASKALLHSRIVLGGCRTPSRQSRRRHKRRTHSRRCRRLRRLGVLRRGAPGRRRAPGRRLRRRSRQSRWQLRRRSTESWRLESALMPLRCPPASVFIAMITHAAVLWHRRVRHCGVNLRALHSGHHQLIPLPAFTCRQPRALAHRMRKERSEQSAHGTCRFGQ